MSPLLPSLFLLAALPLASQAPPAAPPPAAAPAPSAAEDAAYAKEARALLDMYRFAEIARHGFMEASKDSEAARKDQKAFQCMADQFTTEFFEPYLRPLMREYMSYGELVEANAFLRSPLGLKFRAQVHAAGMGRTDAPSFSESDGAELASLMTKPFFQNFMAFNTKGLARFAQSAAGRQEIPAKMREKCKALFQP